MTYAERTKQIVKAIVSAAVYYTGILHLLRIRKLKGRATILMYHRVLDPDNMPKDYARRDIVVNKSSYRRHLKYLKRHYRLMSLGQLLELLHGDDPLPKNVCVVTFDDGWRDTFDYAYPIAAELDVPITVFVATNFIEEKEWFWEQRFKYLLSSLWHAGFALPSAEGFNFEKNLGIRNLERISGDQLIDLATTCISKLKSNQDWIPLAMEQLEGNVAKLHLSRPFSNWDEVAAMNRHGVEIGAHTVTHPDLTSCDSPTVQFEVSDSVARIERVLGEKIDVFAYPYGKHDDRVVKVVRDSPISAACTIKSGFVSKASEHHALPRIGIHEDVAPTTAMFASRILKLFNRY